MSAVKDNATDHGKEKAPAPLDEGDISMLKSYGKRGFYPERCSLLEEEIEKQKQIVNQLIGVRESDTGLLPPSQWDLRGDQQMLTEEAPLLLGNCTKIIETTANSANTTSGEKESKDQTKYVVKVRNMARFVVGLGEKVSPTDIEEGVYVSFETSQTLKSFCVRSTMKQNVDTHSSILHVYIVTFLLKACESGWIGPTTRYKSHFRQRLMRKSLS